LNVQQAQVQGESLKSGTERKLNNSVASHPIFELEVSKNEEFNRDLFMLGALWLTSLMR
jgi:hypothetical protein